jgi:hypothetical protein
VLATENLIHRLALDPSECSLLLYQSSTSVGDPCILTSDLYDDTFVAAVPPHEKRTMI